MLTQVRAVLFDLDSALFDHRATVRGLAVEQAACLKGLVPLDQCGLYVQRLAELESLGYLDRLSVYRQLVQELALDAGHRRMHPRRLATDFERRYAAHAVARPGALETLQALKARGLRLGIVTNGRVAAQGAKVDAIGLRPLIDDVLVSEEAGVRKPDPAIYRCALARMGLAAEETLHVGAHPERDIRGARSAGLRAVWLSRGRTPLVEADAVLEDLPAVLAELPG